MLGNRGERSYLFGLLGGFITTTYARIVLAGLRNLPPNSILTLSPAQMCQPQTVITRLLLSRALKDSPT